MNLYIIEGGINGWLDAYPPHPCVAERSAEGDAMRASSEGTLDEPLAWSFSASVGERIPSAHPEVFRRDPAPDCSRGDSLAPPAARAWFDGRASEPIPSFTRKVALQRKVLPKGGCG